MAKKKKVQPSRLSRRKFLTRAGLALVTGAAFPHVWIRNTAIAQTAGRGRIKHLLYIRLASGFRFPPAFNANVADEFNPFGAAKGVATGTKWGVGALLASAPYLDGTTGVALSKLGMRSVPQLASEITVLPCVDHEPLAASADGNHTTGLERFYTGFVNGDVGFFTMINYGLRERTTMASKSGQLLLPAFVLGGSGMGRGLGMYAAHRPPVISGSGFDRFSVDTDAKIPSWAEDLASHTDNRLHDRLHPAVQAPMEAYIETRKATGAYAKIFNSTVLKIDEPSSEKTDGVSNDELRQIFGDVSASHEVRLALRLFHFGSPAAYVDQGGYDMHSGEETGLPPAIASLNRILSGLHLALKLMQHPDGGTYWDHTAVVLGSEFSRTTRGGRFNSARGSDHGGDLATRYMSMPFMGGPFASVAGQQLGETRASDLLATGKVYSYRSVLKTLLDGLGADHKDFFPGDAPFADLFG